MLTAKENMREAVRGGNPDRFVNQYEAVALLMHPYMLTQPLLKKAWRMWSTAGVLPIPSPPTFPALSRYIPPIRSL